MIEPRPYLDSEQWSKIRLKATNVIQCYTRGMFARSLARKFKAELEYNRQYYLEMQVRREKEMEETREREIERRIHPKSAKDFEVLYKELEAWRVSETQKIEVQDVTPAEKQVRIPTHSNPFDVPEACCLHSGPLVPKKITKTCSTGGAVPALAQGGEAGANDRQTEEQRSQGE